MEHEIIDIGDAPNDRDVNLKSEVGANRSTNAASPDAFITDSSVDSMDPKRESPSSNTRENLDVKSKRNEATSLAISSSGNELPVSYSIQHQLCKKWKNMPEIKNDETAYAVPINVKASENNLWFKKNRTLENDECVDINLKQNNIDFDKSLLHEILKHGSEASPATNSRRTIPRDFPEIHKTTMNNLNSDFDMERERKSSESGPFENPLYGVISEKSASSRNPFENNDQYVEMEKKRKKIPNEVEKQMETEIVNHKEIITNRFASSSCIENPSMQQQVNPSQEQQSFSQCKRESNGGSVKSRCKPSIIRNFSYRQIHKHENECKDTKNMKNGGNVKITRNVKLGADIEPTPNFHQFPISQNHQHSLLPKRSKENKTQAANRSGIDNLVFSPHFSVSIHPRTHSPTCECSHECIEICDVPDNRVGNLCSEVDNNNMNAVSPDAFITNSRLTSYLQRKKALLYTALFLGIMLAIFGVLAVSFSWTDYRGFSLICVIQIVIFSFSLLIAFSNGTSK